MKLSKIINWFKYIAWRRAYWDCVIEHGTDSVATRWFRRKASKYATMLQYDFMIKYGEYLEEKYHG